MTLEFGFPLLALGCRIEVSFGRVQEVGGKRLSRDVGAIPGFFHYAEENVNSLTRDTLDHGGARTTS